MKLPFEGASVVVPGTRAGDYAQYCTTLMIDGSRVNLIHAGRYSERMDPARAAWLEIELATLQRSIQANASATANTFKAVLSAMRRGATREYIKAMYGYEVGRNR